MQVNAVAGKFISTPVTIMKKTQPNKWFVKNIYGLQCKITARRFLALWHPEGEKIDVPSDEKSAINELTGTMLVIWIL